MKSASACNLTPTGKRENAYKALYLRMQEKMPTLGDLPYKQLKLACMAHLYSSKAEPRKLFGEDTPELACFYETMDELLPGANELNYGLVALWDAQTSAHEWTLPDGFDVVVKVMDKVEDPVIFNGVEYIMVRKVNQPMKKGRSLGANVIHSVDGLVVREMGRRCSYAPEAVARVRKDLASTVCGYSREVDFQLIRVLEAWRMSGFLSAVVIEYIDAQNAGHLSDEEKRAVLALLDSLPSKTFDLVMVHDCFRALPGNGNHVRQQYINILAEMADSNMLNYLVGQLSKDRLGVQAPPNELGNLIRQSNYAIC